MPDTALDEQLRRLFDDAVPPITEAEIRTRGSAREPMPSPRRRVLVVAALLVAVGAAVTYAATRDDDGILGVSTRPPAPTVAPETSIPASEPQSTEPPVGSRDWPELITATPNRGEVLRVDAASGSVIGRFRPEGLMGGFSGVTGDAQGRVAIWADHRIWVEDREADPEEGTFELSLEVSWPNELEVAFVPDATAVWVTQSSTPDDSVPAVATTVWRADYRTGEVEQVSDDLPPSSPIGVTGAGRLVLEARHDARVPPDATFWLVGPTVDETEEVRGAPGGIRGDLIGVKTCPAAGPCTLSILDVETGASTAVDPGPFDPDAVVMMHSSSVIPGMSPPLPSGAPVEPRVLLAALLPVAGEPRLKPIVLDLETGVLGELPTEVDIWTAAVWSCDGTDLLFLEDGLSSMSGDISGLRLPEDTFLLGVGAC